MSCIGSSETFKEFDRRVDCMLREMVVVEGLQCLSENRPPRNFTLEEIGDFIGVHWETIRRVEEKALRKMRDKVI